MAKRTELKELTHEKVLKAAGDLFAKHGYRKATIRDIAAQSDVSVGSVMSVGDKATLLVTIFDRAIAAIHDQRATGDSRSRSEEDTAVDRVAQLVDPFLNMFAEQIDLSREYGAILMSGNHQSVLFDALGDALQSEIAAEAHAAGLDDSVTTGAAKTAYFAYLGTLFFWAARGSVDGTEPRDDFRSVLNYIFSK